LDGYIPESPNSGEFGYEEFGYEEFGYEEFGCRATRQTLGEFGY
jgi:hypothetical protein